MATPVRQLVHRLEERRNALIRQILERGLSQEDRSRVESKIRAATMAVYHYLSAASSEKSALQPPQ